jgi:spermidine synthase
MKIHVGDGRKFIETTENRYDIIFLDAFGSDDIPYSLTTREFLSATRSKLNAGGIVVANVWGSLDNKLYPSMVRTYRDVFEELHIIRAPRSENRILLALPRKLGLSTDDLVKKAIRVQTTLELEFDLNGIIDLGYEPTRDLPGNAKVLLDKKE